MMLRMETNDVLNYGDGEGNVFHDGCMIMIVKTLIYF